MVKTFTLVNVDIGEEDKVKQRIQQMPMVKSVDMLTGHYDLIVVMEDNDPVKIKEQVQQVRNSNGVHSTMTLIVQ